MVYSGKVNIQQAIDDSPFSRFHWVIIVLGFLVLAIDGFDTAAMGYIAPTLSADWGIKKQDLGPVLSAALLGSHLAPCWPGQFPIAWDVNAYWFFPACSLVSPVWAPPMPRR